jgi:hypothetical protein
MKTFKRAAALIVMGCAVLGTASAQDLSNGPVQPGNILVGVGAEYGSYDPSLPLVKESPLFGGAVHADYVLPSVSWLTAGLEAGYNFSALDVPSGDASVCVIPILFRVGYRIGLLPKLDAYAVAKIGGALGFWGGDAADSGWSAPSGLAYGGNIGARFFFTGKIGAFVEMGYEKYVLAYDYEESHDTVTNIDFVNKFATMGVVFKF